MIQVRCVTMTLALMTLAGWADEVAWHHAASPYRAVYEVSSQPNTRETGYFILVPVCGLGDENGASVYAFDQDHRALKMRALGPSQAGLALVQVYRGDPIQRIYAYWGANRRAPQYDMMAPGLTVTIRALPDDVSLKTWADCREAYESSDPLGILPLRQLELAGNPLTMHTRFIYDIRGAFRQERGEKVSLFLAHDDAAFLLVDGKRVIEHPGAHRVQRYVRGEGRQTIPLDQGLTPIQCLVFCNGGRSTAVLARFDNPRQKYALPPDAFAQPGQTTLLAVESRHKSQPCPAFQVEHSAYIAIDDYVFTELKLNTSAGVPVQWAMGDGGRAEGQAIRTIRVGLEPLSVSTRADRRSRDVAQATVHFATVPLRYSHNNARHFKHFSQIILGRNLEDLDLPTLTGYLHLLNLKERNPDSVPVAQAIVQHEGFRRFEHQLEIYLALARGAAANQPEVAADAYRQVLRLTRDEAIIFEYLEFLLYRQDDLAEVERQLGQAARVLGRQHLQLARYRAEAALLRGDVEEATAGLRTIQSHIRDQGQHRQSLVQANEHIERFRDHLAGDWFLEAEADLRALGITAPQLYTSGHYAVLRSRLFRSIGWPMAAVRLIDRTLGLNALPAFLPDLELEKAFALSALKQHDEARSVFTRIAEQYPNHPAAATARQHLKN